MIDNIMNDDKTIAGGGKDMILTGCYYILLFHKLIHALRF